MKTLIVVSGGDAPGINTAVARFMRLAARNQDEVLGAQGGFAGLLAGDMVEMNPKTLALLAGRGGTYLSSSRVPVLKAVDARQKLAAVLKRRGIDNLLLFGGDGTFKHILPRLRDWDIACVALPTTIDNDVAGTDYTLGHDSACNFAVQTIEGIAATAHALPGRIFMVETLGGDSGYLALSIAYASAAQIALVPEYPWPPRLYRRLKTLVAQSGYALLVVSEGVPSIRRLIDDIPGQTGSRLRHIKLGHAQRGAAVSHRDRCAAHDMGFIAWQALRDGLRIGAVVSREGAMTLHEGTLPDEAKPPPDYRQYALVNDL